MCYQCKGLLLKFANRCNENDRKCNINLTIADPIITVAYSPDGRLLASGGKDQTVRIWNIETGKCLKVLQCHTRWIYAVDFIYLHSNKNLS